MLMASPHSDQERFRQAHRQLGAIITASPLAIVGVDAQAVIFIWNAAAERIFGWREAEVIGRPVPYIPEGLREEAYGYLKRVMAGETVNGVFVRRQRQDGSLIDLRLHTAALRDSQGDIMGAVLMFEDVSEHQRSERQKNAIADLASALRPAFSRSEIMKTVLRMVMELLPADGAAISVPLPDGLLLCEFTAGLWSAWQDRIVPAAGSTGSQVLATGTAFISNDIANDERLIYRHLMQGFQSACCGSTESGCHLRRRTCAC
jgi:PAS domain S-box-containing protein